MPIFLNAHIIVLIVYKISCLISSFRSLGGHLKPGLGKRLVLLSLLTSLFGCATVSISSYPSDATVSVVLPGDASEREIGKTPFVAKLGKQEGFANEGAIVFVVRKHGYLSQHFVVPNIAHTDIKINTNLLPDLPTNSAEVNKIISLAFQSERMIMQKRFDEAQKIGEQIQAINPNIATAYEILGTTHFLKNNLREARFAWMRVLELEPDNLEATKMLTGIEIRMGIRRNAGKKAEK